MPRCEELSIELLNLVNAKNSLLRECEQVRAQRDNLLNMSRCVGEGVGVGVSEGEGEGEGVGVSV